MQAPLIKNPTVV